MRAFCPNCGTGNEVTGKKVTCSACTLVFEPTSVSTEPRMHQPAAPQPAAPIVTTTNAGPPASIEPLAIASLVMAFCCAPVGLILGVMAIKQIDASHGAKGGRPIAIVGVALSAVWVVIGVLSALFGR